MYWKKHWIRKIRKNLCASSFPVNIKSDYKKQSNCEDDSFHPSSSLSMIPGDNHSDDNSAFHGWVFWQTHWWQDNVFGRHVRKMWKHEKHMNSLTKCLTIFHLMEFNGWIKKYTKWICWKPFKTSQYNGIGRHKKTLCNLYCIPMPIPKWDLWNRTWVLKHRGEKNDVVVATALVNMNATDFGGTD